VSARVILLFFFGLLSIILSSCTSNEAVEKDMDCPLPESKNIVKAFQQASKVLSRPECEYDVMSIWKKLLKITQGNPQPQNREYFDEFLTWLNKANLIEDNQQKELFGRFFDTTFVSLPIHKNRSVCDYCYDSKYGEKKLLKNIDEEMEQKQLGLFEILGDESLYKKSLKNSNDLKVIIKAACTSCAAKSSGYGEDGTKNPGIEENIKIGSTLFYKRRQEIIETVSDFEKHFMVLKRKLSQQGTASSRSILFDLERNVNLSSFLQVYNIKKGRFSKDMIHNNNIAVVCTAISKNIDEYNNKLKNYSLSSSKYVPNSEFFKNICRYDKNNYRMLFLDNYKKIEKEQINILFFLNKHLEIEIELFNYLLDLIPKEYKKSHLKGLFLDTDIDFLSDQIRTLQESKLNISIENKSLSRCKIFKANIRAYHKLIEATASAENKVSLTLLPFVKKFTWSEGSRVLCAD